MNTRKTNPTMKDVAKEAGVALGTVSKVFNDIPVGDAYKEKVLKAADKLGYQVNNYARGLKTNKTNTVAVILPSLTHPFFSVLAEYAGRALKARGYRMIFMSTEFSIKIEQECLEMVRMNKVDGIICISYNPDLVVDMDLPFVSIDRYINTTIPCVSSDNFGGGQLAAQKLTELGCKNLLFLRAGSNVQGESDKRQLGFDSWCHMNEISHHDIVLFDGQEWDIFWEYLDEHAHEYDGIFCATDHLAYHTVKKLRSMGIQVPEEIQVIGFDGIQTFYGEDFICSTIVQPIRQLAETAVNILLDEKSMTLSPLMCLPITYAPGGTTKE